MTQYQQQAKTILILWKWQELIEKNAPYNEIAVTDDPLSKVIQINENKREDFITIFQEISKKLDKPPHKALLFLHSSALNQQDWVPIYEAVFKNTKVSFSEIIFFSSGSNYIYYQPIYDAGLLTQKGGFPNDTVYRYIIPGTTEKKSKRASVIAFAENQESYKIIKKYFDTVWAYYHYKPKQRFFELKENLFIYLIGCNAMQNAQSAKLADFLGNHRLYEELSELLQKQVWNERLSEFYQGEQLEIMREHYHNLVDFINERAFDNTYLKDMRAQFATLLGATTETIYG